MALKLDVPWRKDHLSVTLPDGYDEVINAIRVSGPPYVRTEGHDVIVGNFFKESNDVLDVNANNVLDVSRYLIGEEDCCVHDGDRYRICNDRYLNRHCDIPESEIETQQTGSIVLLLESPHKNEYEYIDRGFARRKKPACGKTGEQIDLCLGTVLLHILIETGLVNSGCHVVISNPIQFQTSLYAIHKQEAGNWTTLRNNVWRALWDADERENHITQCFQRRLGRYHPKVIINACTSDLKPRVTDCVEAWISRRVSVVPLYEIDHPSNWENLRPKLINPYAIPDAADS